jgi:hypothetical protein
MAPREPKFVAVIPVTSRSDGGVEAVGTAQVEELSRGIYVYHFDASSMSAEQLRRGLSFGKFTIPEETQKE